MYVVHAIGRIDEVTRICPTAETKSESTWSFSDLVTLVRLVESISPLVDIHAHTCISKISRIAEIFWSTDDFWVRNIFGVKYARWITYIFRSHHLRYITIKTSQFQELLIGFLLRFDRLFKVCFESVFVLVFRIGDIKNMVFLIFQSETSITIRTSITISEKIRVSTRIHIKWKMHIIRISCIKELIGFLAIIETKRVDDPFTWPNICAIEAFIVTFRIETQIAIFHIATVVWILWVFHPFWYCFSWHRNNFFEFFPLLEKWFRKIKISPIRSSIPLVTVPILFLIDGTGCIGWKERYEFDSCCIAFSFVDIFLVSPCIPPDFSARRTQSRQGKSIFDSINNRGKSVEKDSIDIFNTKLRRTVSARNCRNHKI